MGRGREAVLMGSPARAALVLILCIPGFAPWATGRQYSSNDVSMIEVPPSLLRDLPLGAEAQDNLKHAIQERRYRQAETLLLEQSQQNPKSPALFKLLGAVLFLDGQYLNSAIAFKKSNALLPLDHPSRFTLAMAYVALGRNDWARKELEVLAASDERNAQYYYWLARLDYNDMDFTSSLANAKLALNVDPNFARAYESLGLTNEALGKSEEAIEAYQSAVRLSTNSRPPSPWPAMELGALLIKLGRLGEASSYLRQSVERDPQFPKAHFQMGLLLEKQGKLDEAIRELNQTAALEPSYPEPHYILGRVYREKGEEKAAAQAFRDFEELSRRQKSKEKLRQRSR